MGACWSSCGSRSNKRAILPSCFKAGLFGLSKTQNVFCDHTSMLHHLPSIPNRIFTNGKSRASCIFTQQGRKGINQDAMIVWEDFMSENVIFCGVFDGHGPHGHLVARRVRDDLPIKLLSFLQPCESRQNDSSSSCLQNGLKSDDEDDLENEGSIEDDTVDFLWRDAFLKSYKAMDKELRSHPNLDCFCSGSTAVTIVKQGLNLFMGNIGDSRAIMGSRDSSDSIVAIQLTVDLKPDLPKEAERIQRCRGRVFAMQDEPEVPRVWLPFDDAPGLAMARAFGDFCLKEYGVISIPEFSHRTLTEKDMFIVLASDGVWDVLSNEEVVKIVYSASTRSSAAKILVESAAREWKLKYPTSKMDDCAVVCLFLDDTLTNSVSKSDIGALEPDSEASLQNNNENENWSGLEGVTRVNSIVQLPRFSQEKTTPI